MKGEFKVMKEFEKCKAIEKLAETTGVTLNTIQKRKICGRYRLLSHNDKLCL